MTKDRTFQVADVNGAGRNKADKVRNATAGDLAALTETGNLSDSGIPSSDVARKSAIEGGDLVAAKAVEAGNLSSWAGRDNLSVGETFDEAIRTSGGSESIDSGAGCIVEKIVAKSDFYAAKIVNTGKNLLRRATAVGDGWYFPVPALPFGTYGTAEEPNGILFVAPDGSNLTPTVKFKALASGVPASVDDGDDCSYVDSHGYRFYTTTEPGYIIVSGIDRAETCARIAWSTDYDQYVAVDDAADAGGELDLTGVIHALHDYDRMLVVAGVADEIERISDAQVLWTRRNDRVVPTWTTEAGEEAGTYVHTATIAGMLPGGGAQMEGVSLSVSGNTVSVTDDSADAPAGYVYYNLAVVVTGNVNLATAIGINDWGLTILEGAVGEADITMSYAQGYPDAVAALLNGGVDAKIAPVEEKVASNTSRIVALESYAFGRDLSYVDPITDGQLLLRSTANSYRVKRAGAYRLPLVYGNAIKRGADNPAAYTRLGSTYTADFVNHLGNAITSPWIEDNTGCTAASVGLLWQTAQGMITDVQLFEGADGKYLAFTVGSVPATNGLAVVYVKDADGEIMWSWMIWVTADSLDLEDTVNYTGVTYQMMPELLGAIWNAERTKYVAPHYQWGRKDPMCPAAGPASTANLALYDIDGNAYAGFGGYGVADDADAGGTVRSVANSIRMPEKFFLEFDATKYNWNNLDWFNNFWNAAETDSSSLADNQASAVKTIYDPSLPGMMLPSGRFATGFTTTGSNTSTPEQFNVIGEFDNGWKFKKKASDAVGAYYPAAGSRNRTSGELGNVGSNGNYWTFAPNSQTYACYLYFTAGNVYPLNVRSRANGFSVRSARELN